MRPAGGIERAGAAAGKGAAPVLQGGWGLVRRGAKNNSGKIKKHLLFLDFSVKIHTCAEKRIQNFHFIGGGVWFAEYQVCQEACSGERNQGDAEQGRAVRAEDYPEEV
jgi:hypothetical protein